MVFVGGRVVEGVARFIGVRGMDVGFISFIFDEVGYIIWFLE